MTKMEPGPSFWTRMWSGNVNKMLNLLLRHPNLEQFSHHLERIRWRLKVPTFSHIGWFCASGAFTLLHLPLNSLKFDLKCI